MFNNNFGGNVMTRYFLLPCLIITLILSGTIACSSGDNAADENQDLPAGTTVTGAGDTPAPVEDQAVEFDMTAEVLFDGESLPDEWPDFLPIRPDMMVTEYTYENEELHAYGYAPLAVYRFSNWVHNMFLEENTMVDWEQDPNNETVERGPEQIFYIVMEGWSLAIELKEIDDETTTFDITMNPA